MNLSSCKICGGKVDFCEWCGGCHLIVCSNCKASFDLAGCVPNENADTIEELREQIADTWNHKTSVTAHTKECGHECYECSLNGIGAGE